MLPTSHAVKTFRDRYVKDDPQRKASVESEAFNKRREDMSVRDIEKKIWMESKRVFCNSKLRLKDILEWSNSERVVKGNLQEAEVMAELPASGFWVAIPQSCDKRKIASE